MLKKLGIFAHLWGILGSVVELLLLGSQIFSLVAVASDQATDWLPDM